MKLLIVSHAAIIKQNDQWTGYAPYIKEIDLWVKYADEATFICPTTYEGNMLGKELENQGVKIVSIPPFSFVSGGEMLRAPRAVFVALRKIWVGMRQADHIHLRCPGNVGLLGCVAQVFFPKKKKTAKYAGNWDANSSQPLSYRFQKWVLNNTMLTKNMQVMVYGNWPDSTKNVKPFFTASYPEALKLPTLPRQLVAGGVIKLIFVGVLHEGKRPLLSIQIAAEFISKGIDARLDIFGEGPMRAELEDYIRENGLGAAVQLHGNQPAALVQTYFREAHFLIFLSKSEGWPKVVSEAMWWGCLPVTTAVSCVRELVGDGARGSVIEPSVGSAVDTIGHYLSNPGIYAGKAEAAMEWSRQFTLEKFEESIAGLLAGNG